MNLSAPKNLTWLIAVVLGVIGLIAYLMNPAGAIGFWLAFLGFAVLAVATFVEGI